jgi:hypothetical protein
VKAFCAEPRFSASHSWSLGTCQPTGHTLLEPPDTSHKFGFTVLRQSKGSLEGIIKREWPGLSEADRVAVVPFTAVITAGGSDGMIN